MASLRREGYNRITPTRNVQLTEELDRFISTSVESGRYEDADEVFCAALLSLERDPQGQETKLARVQVAIDEGDASVVAEPGVLDRVRRHLELSV